MGHERAFGREPAHRGVQEGVMPWDVQALDALPAEGALLWVWRYNCLSSRKITVSSQRIAETHAHESHETHWHSSVAARS